MERHPRSGISETWIERGEQVCKLTGTTVGERVRLQAGQHLYHQGEIDPRFYVLVTGKVHVYNLSDEGHEFTFNIMGPGTLIGDAAAMSGQPRYSSARVIEEAEMIRLHAGELEHYVTSDPQFAVALLHLLAIKQRQFVGRLQQVLYEAPEKRITRFLADFVRTHGNESGATVKVNLTHEQIGNLTDLSRVTVTRALNRLKHEGLIDLAGRSIVVNRARAAQMAA
jgi:CRP/FNR family cyclic AMP-dependent transcriptional regulator